MAAAFDLWSYPRSLSTLMPFSANCAPAQCLVMAPGQLIRLTHSRNGSIWASFPETASGARGANTPSRLSVMPLTSTLPGPVSRLLSRNGPMAFRRAMFAWVRACAFGATSFPGRCNQMTCLLAETTS
jgi:hypothetical protein